MPASCRSSDPPLQGLQAGGHRFDPGTLHSVSLDPRSSSAVHRGGEIFVPLPIYVFGFTQHKAQGTSLVMLLPPIGLLAALRY
jgi:hypothetical protein